MKMYSDFITKYLMDTLVVKYDTIWRRKMGLFKPQFFIGKLSARLSFNLNLAKKDV